MDNLKKVIEAEAEKIIVDDAPIELMAFESYAWKRGNVDGFIKGCNFMAGHLEKALEWGAEKGYRYGSETNLWFPPYVGKPLTTSQLIDKYFNELKTKP